MSSTPVDQGGPTAWIPDVPSLRRFDADGNSQIDIGSELQAMAKEADVDGSGSVDGHEAAAFVSGLHLQNAAVRDTLVMNLQHAGEAGKQPIFLDDSPVQLAFPDPQAGKETPQTDPASAGVLGAVKVPSGAAVGKAIKKASIRPRDPKLANLPLPTSGSSGPVNTGLRAKVVKSTAASRKGREGLAPVGAPTPPTAGRRLQDVNVALRRKR